MDLADDLYCNVCQKAYHSSETSPRCLNCGHIFCSTCITSLTLSKVKCPKCQAMINVLSAEDIDNINSSVKSSSSIDSLNLLVSKDVSCSSEESNKSHEQVLTDSISPENVQNSVVIRNDGREINSVFSSSGMEEKTPSSEMAPTQNQNPIVLVQECDSIISSESNSRNEEDSNLCCNSLEIHMSNHLHPPSIIHPKGEDSPPFMDQTRSSDESENNPSEKLSPDASDYRFEHPFRLTTDKAIPGHDNPHNMLDIDVQSRKDSLIVHCSSTTELDHIAMNTDDLGGRSLEENFCDTKQIELQRFADQIQILHEVLETVDDAILTLRVEQEQHEVQKKNLIQLIEEEEEKLEQTKLKINEAQMRKTSMQELTETLKKGEDAVVQANSLDSLRNAVKDSNESMVLAEDLGTQTELCYMQFLISKNVQKPEYLERMIDLGVNVFAEHQVDGEWRWARVSLLNGLIHIHSLKAEPPPSSQCQLLPWSCLRAMVPNDNASTFLDISVEGKSKGRVYLTMHGDTPRAQQFVILSSGEHKYCYKGVRMKQLGNQEQPGEYVSFHGPKNPRGNPARGVVSGITQGGVYTKRKSAGLLAGAALSHRQRTLFVVYLVPDPDEDTTGAFGEVTEGLEVLKSASRHKAVHEVEIEDCGIIIPLNNLDD